MEFLVHNEVKIPTSMDPGEKEALLARETARGKELQREGTIKRIWRIPGRVASYGIWEAPDPTALHAKLSSLPLFPYIDCEVIALAQHGLEAK